MKQLQKELTDLVSMGNVCMDEPLYKYSTIRIGGPADFVVKVRFRKEFVSVLTLLTDEKVPYVVLGGGTNVLISDKGFSGVVIKNETNSIQMTGMRGEIEKGSKGRIIRDVFIEADSGVSMNRLVRFALDQNLSGLEPFLGQPGSVGGALYINAHNMHLKKYVGDSVVSATLFTKSGEIRNVSVSYLKFGYDTSRIQTTKDIILGATFQLHSATENGVWPVSQKTLEYRRMTQPQGIYCAGCIFRNIKKSDAMRLSTPGYTCSAGFLIDSAGLKGKKIGNAQYSTHHANFIINTGGATGSDVLQLIALAKDKVKDKFGVDLEEEVVLIGDF